MSVSSANRPFRFHCPTHAEHPVDDKINEIIASLVKREWVYCGFQWEFRDTPLSFHTIRQLKRLEGNNCEIILDRPVGTISSGEDDSCTSFAVSFVRVPGKEVSFPPQASYQELKNLATELEKHVLIKISKAPYPCSSR